MSYQFTFDEQAVYGAKDINRITARLVTAGIADGFEENGKPYNLCETDSETGATVYQSGVRPSDTSLKAELSEDGKSVTIQPGQAFMGDGTLFTVFLPDPTEDTPNPASDVRLSYTPGVKNYVYIQNDYEYANSSYPVCSKTPPSGDFVLLAEIEPDGTVTDRRAYAAGKIPAQNMNYMPKEYQVSVNCKPVPTLSADGTYYRYYRAEGTATVNIESGRRYVYIYSKEGSRCIYGIYDLANKTYECIRLQDGNYKQLYNDKLYTFYSDDSYYAYTTINASQNQLTFQVSYKPRKELHPDILESDKNISHQFSFLLI